LINVRIGMDLLNGGEYKKNRVNIREKELVNI